MLKSIFQCSYKRYIQIFQLLKNYSTLATSINTITQMIWVVLIGIVVFVLFKFFNDLNKDNYDLQGRTLADKFQFTTAILNEEVFNGRGQIIPLDKRSFNLYADGENQIIHFVYSTGHLTITWKYKFYQKEVVHEKTFRDARNLSVFEQQRIAEALIREMAFVVERHKNNVISDL